MSENDVDGKLAPVINRVNSNTTSISSLQSQKANTTYVDNAINNVNSRVNTIDTKVEANKSNITTLQNRVTSTESRISNNESRITNLNTLSGSNTNKITALETSLNTTKNQVSTNSTNITNLERTKTSIGNYSNLNVINKVVNMPTIQNQMTVLARNFDMSKCLSLTVWFKRQSGGP